jgi:hypothetical protein
MSVILHRWWRRRYRIAARQHRTFTNDLRPSHDRLCIISIRDTRPRRRTRHLDEARENSRANTIKLAALAASATLSELDLARVESARELWDERTVKRVGARARSGGCAMEHARELVRIIQHTTRAKRVVHAIRQERRERWHVLLKNTTCRLWRDVLYRR